MQSDNVVLYSNIFPIFYSVKAEKEELKMSPSVQCLSVRMPRCSFQPIASACILIKKNTGMCLSLHFVPNLLICVKKSYKYHMEVSLTCYRVNVGNIINLTCHPRHNLRGRSQLSTFTY